MTYLLVFALGAIIDLMYVMWIDAVNKRYILRAGAYSVGIAAPGLFGFLEIVSDVTMAIPYLLGLACGTMGTLYFKKPAPEELVDIQLEFTPQQMQDFQDAGLIVPVYNFTPEGVAALTKAKNETL